MKGKCPNVSDNKTKTAMNAIIGAYGGRPMTEREFRSSHAQSTRVGVDRLSTNNMYKIYRSIPDKHVDSFIDGIISISSSSAIGDGRSAIIKYINGILSNVNNADSYSVEKDKIIFDSIESEIESILKTLDIRCKSIKAEDGMDLGFTPGGKWSLHKDLDGIGKTHSEGGIDIEVSDSGRVMFKKNNSKLHAYHGMIIKSSN